MIHIRFCYYSFSRLHGINLSSSLNFEFPIQAIKFFRTGFVTEGDFAQGVKDLVRKDSCNLIVDDVTYINESFFQDGVISRVIDSVSALGVSYLSAAGNFGNKSYQSNFNPVVNTRGETVHLYENGKKEQLINLKKSAWYTVVLQWADSIYSQGQLPGATTDLDIYLTDKNGTVLVGNNTNNIGKDPVEVLTFHSRGSTKAYVKIKRASGSGTTRSMTPSSSLS